MQTKYLDLLKQKIDQENFSKLEALNHPELLNFIGEYIELCNPEKVFVRTDSEQDIAYIRKKTIALEEEKKLAVSGHSFHFDGPNDQARDKKNTRYLIPQGPNMSDYVNSLEKQSGLTEIRTILKDIMKGKEMFICFFCLGPVDSEFSILAVQLTDSSYVSHSEDILYRAGYEQFKKNKPTDFFKFVHSAGDLEGSVSKNVDKRRVFIDLANNLVYSANTQYAGNTVGLKKLSLRLAIQKASGEGWLAEHMFLMGVLDSEGKKAYFAGAYPSMCGKTSTAMIQGEKIVGDDIAYIREREGKAYSVNVERGIFGIIKDVNSNDDPILFKSLNSPGEVIFSNILIDEKLVPFWIGKDKNIPDSGVNFSGEWSPGKADAKGNEIPPSHKNARYTIRLKDLENVDENLENPQGVELSGLIYGGRDSDTSCPAEQALSWEQGIVTKAASLESETTAATLGAEGVRVFNPMSNMDFLSIPLGKYLEMNLAFGKKIKSGLPIFSVNYFLRDKDNNFTNSVQDKRVWLKWIRARADNKVKALLTPTGSIPKYQDLKALFKQVLDKEYSEAEYNDQFKLRINENLAKIERIRNIYQKQKGIPEVVLKELAAQEERLKACKSSFGDYVLPEQFKQEV